LAKSSQSLSREAFRRFASYKLSIVGLVILAIVVLMALFADTIAPLGATDIDLEEVGQGPSSKHLLGTDDIGRDVWARVAFGAQTSLIVGVGAVSISLLIGISDGLASG
jgi:ABC-type dipeptide/oligopeptide/nickel transport system permease subunit